MIIILEFLERTKRVIYFDRVALSLKKSLRLWRKLVQSVSEVLLRISNLVQIGCCVLRLCGCSDFLAVQTIAQMLLFTSPADSSVDVPCLSHLRKNFLIWLYIQGNKTFSPPFPASVDASNRMSGLWPRWLRAKRRPKIQSKVSITTSPCTRRGTCWGGGVLAAIVIRSPLSFILHLAD